ncbi:MAG: hypothetical protein NZ578_00945 [Candidatus Binatia bacterium]|nr:hypothetical protein [Candidatus Binatia bacterium]
MVENALQNIKDFHDVIRLLEEHPEWRAELRRLILTDELLALPQRIDRLSEQVAALAEAQARTEARVAELAEAQARTDARVTALVEAQARTEARVAELAEAQARTEAQVALLTNRVDVLAQVQQRLLDDIGTLKGRDLERTYQEKAAVFFDSIVQEPRVLPFAEIRPLLDDAVRRGVLSAEERRELIRTDLFVQGRHPDTGEAMYLVVEVSWSVYSTDVERAATRAALLRKLDVPVVAVVAGMGIMPEAHREATNRGVWQMIDGTAVPPVAA